MLGIGWEDAEARIVSRRLDGKHTEPDEGEFAGQGVEVYEYIADVRPGDGSEPFRAVLKEPFKCDHLQGARGWAGSAREVQPQAPRHA